MNRTEKDNSRSLKREKLKVFLAERRFQKDTQAAARKETARRLTSERRARLVLERAQARQLKEALRGKRIESRVKIRIPESGKTASLPIRPKAEKRKVFTGEKTQPVSGEEEAKPSFPAFAKNRQAEKRQKLLSYLEKYRVKKSEIIAGKIKQKETAAKEKQDRRAERRRQKQSLRQQKLAGQLRKKTEAAALLVQKSKEAEVIREESVRKAEAIRVQKEAQKQEIAVQRQAPAAKIEKEKELLIVIPEEKVPAIKKLSRFEKRRQLLLYLTKIREAKAEVLIRKQEQKETAAREKQARRVERRRQKQSLRQSTKPVIPVQNKAGETVLAVIGQTYKRQQLLAYLKKRKSGEKTFAVQRREVKKTEETAIPKVILAPVVPKVMPVVMPLPTLPENTEAVPEKVITTKEEKPVPAAGEEPVGRRLKLPLGRGKKIPSDTAELSVVPQAALSSRKPFRPVPFLKDHFVKIIFGLLVLGWFVEITMLNQRLESVRQQLEQAAGITKSHRSSEALITATVSPLALGTTRVEGIRDPFSNELWRIQEITPAQARAVSRPLLKIPAPSSIIKPITPILVTKPPEFTPPEIARAIPESAKLARIPQVAVPQVGSVSTPAVPVSSLRFRGILNVAGIDYFFIEGAGGGYRVRIGDTVEGFKIYDYRNGILYFAKDGNTYQLNEERASPPFRYRGRMIMAGQEYFFLEGQRTYRAVIGEEVEGYRLIKRVGDYLYFVKDDRLYYLKQE